MQKIVLQAYVFQNYNKLGAVFIFVKEGKIMQEKEKVLFFINEQIKEKPLNKNVCKKSIVYGSA